MKGESIPNLPKCVQSKGRVYMRPRRYALQNAIQVPFQKSNKQ